MAVSAVHTELLFCIHRVHASLPRFPVATMDIPHFTRVLSATADVLLLANNVLRILHYNGCDFDKTVDNSTMIIYVFVLVLMVVMMMLTMINN